MHVTNFKELVHVQNDLEAWKMSPNYNYDIPKQGFVRIAALRLFCKKKKKKSVTLFLKSLNDYKHFILRTTLKKRFTKLSVNQLPEFLKSDREIP